MNAHRWLYSLFIAINANFRLKQKDMSKDSVDPSLGQGWSFFVQEAPYKEYLQKNAHIRQEVSDCCGYFESELNVAGRKVLAWGIMPSTQQIQSHLMDSLPQELAPLIARDTV